MSSKENRSIESIIIDVMNNGITFKAQLYQDLKELTDNFSQTVLSFVIEDIESEIKNLESKYIPIPNDWSKPFIVIAPKVYDEKMSLINGQLSNLKELLLFISENTINKLNKDQETIIEEQNNLIPHITIGDVFSHFRKLTEMTNKNDEFYLTSDQLTTFIKSTFIDKKPMKQEFNCKGFLKNKIRKIFYNFYFENKNLEKNQTSLKRKYFNIMNEAFEGFNDNDYTDFAK